MTGEELNRALQSIGRRLDVIQDEQRAVIEKLNRMRLAVDSIRDEQKRLAEAVGAVRDGTPGG